jgi:hypothetical protein
LISGVEAIDNDNDDEMSSSDFTMVSALDDVDDGKDVGGSISSLTG